MDAQAHAAKADWVRAALERHGAALTRYAASVTGSEDAARDVVQDVFLRLWEASPERLDAHLPEWLFTVCRNRSIDMQRKGDRMSALTDEQWAAFASRISYVPQGAGPEALAAAVAEAETELVREP